MGHRVADGEEPADFLTGGRGQGQELIGLQLH